MARRLSSLAGIPVTVLEGVGDKRATGLASQGVETVLDLLTFYPRRYLDRTREARVADLRPGEEGTVLVEVRRIGSRRVRGGKVMVTADVSDGSGSLRVTFFNQAWRERTMPQGTQVLLFGKVDTFQGRPQMTNPVVDRLGDRTGRIVPVYPQSEKSRLTTWVIAGLVEEALERAGELVDPVPPAVLDRLDLIDRSEAFRQIHAPDSFEAKEAARRRLVLDELLRVQLRLVMRKRELEQAVAGIRHATEGPLVEQLMSRLPFELTGAQRRTIDEISHDLAGPHPMHRLLQGDVGAGKTLVALAALLVGVQGGHQGALMAPTEVLAEQHALGLRVLLDGLTVADDREGTLFEAAEGADAERPLRLALLTNRTPAAERRSALEGLADGSVDIAVGTHALIQEGVELRSLGVVVVDEQHRFGVEQRAALRAKSSGDAVPDVLVMTATPIPRTAAMTVYGDLDVSVLDEKPPGRTPIATEWVHAEGEAWERVRTEVAAGRQAFVVCPLVEESDKLEAASATETFERLRDGELAGLRLGLLHGRMKGDDKEATMSAFRAGELDVLVATTVIEVGVDVPNATVMVILDADRFGIAQLHQLRGRVGRGAERSYCALVADVGPDNAEGRERLEALVRTDDGFELAEVDLHLRGEGTLMGERQKGRNDLKLASLRRDAATVAVAREIALDLVGDDPSLASQPELAEEVAALLPDDDEADFLLKS